MTKATDFTKAMQDTLAAFPLNNTALQDIFKNQAAYGEKFSKVALDAAEKSAEISARWTKETLARLTDVTRAKDGAQDYTKAASEFAAASAELASENLAAFAEIAKKAQAETIELVLAAGKGLQEEASAAMKKAAEDVTSVAKKASSK